MADWRTDRNQVLAALRTLIDLWDSRAGLGWSVSSDRHGVNVAMINAYTSHAVNLARAVIDLHHAGRSFESISLVRSSMECSVTAAWLALYPEKTPDLLKYSAKERKKLLTDIVRFGGGSASEAIAEVEQIESIEGHTDPEGKWLKSRFNALKGGDVPSALCTRPRGKQPRGRLHGAGAAVGGEPMGNRAAGPSRRFAGCHVARDRGLDDPARSDRSGLNPVETPSQHAALKVGKEVRSFQLDRALRAGMRLVVALTTGAITH
jgi:hypothetical protein